eukprot:jgi/Psemu1/12641/gm1.12641_g
MKSASHHCAPLKTLVMSLLVKIGPTSHDSTRSASHHCITSPMSGQYKERKPPPPQALKHALRLKIHTVSLLVKITIATMESRMVYGIHLPLKCILTALALLEKFLLRGLPGCSIADIRSLWLMLGFCLYEAKA